MAEGGGSSTEGGQQIQQSVKMITESESTLRKAGGVLLGLYALHGSIVSRSFSFQQQFLWFTAALFVFRTGLDYQ